MALKENISVLALASDSGDGQFTRLLDPKLKTQLGEEGIDVQECFMSQLEKKDLCCFDVVLLMRTPVPHHAQGDDVMFLERSPWMTEFVVNGGGLIIMFAESYGKTVSTLNTFAKPFDIQFCFNEIVSRDPKRLSTMPNMPKAALLRCDLKSDVFDHGIDSLDVIISGGHGTQTLTCLPGEDWTTVLTGDDTCESRPFPEGFYANGGTHKIVDPVFCAIREFENGRVAAFPSSSAFWLSNAYLRRWKGYIMEQGNRSGYRFIHSLIRWSASNSRITPSKRAEAGSRFRDRHIMAPEKYSFKSVSLEKRHQLQALRPFKTWVGEADFPDERIVEVAKENDYKVVVILHDYRGLTSDTWKSLRTRYDELGREFEMIVAPGFTLRDDEGNHCAVFNVDELPKMRLKYPNSNMLEDLLVKLDGYTAIYARPSENRIPAWKHGGYTMIEVSNDDDVNLYNEMVASGAFIGAIHIARNKLPGSEKWTNWFSAGELKDVMSAVTKNRHFNFVSSGPRIERFGFFDDDLIDDDWEGVWTAWSEESKERKETRKVLKINLSSDYPIEKLSIWNGLTLYKTIESVSESVELNIPMECDHDFRLRLTATDSNGGELVASWPVYTRNKMFWAHMGSDQMNDYHNVWIKTENGSTGIGDSLYDSRGFVTCGYAWGDYVRITPPTRWSDIMPQGCEVSSLVANFQSFHPSPFIRCEGKGDFLNNHRRRLGFCDNTIHIVHSHSNGSYLDNDDRDIWFDVDGNEYIPTRHFRTSDLWKMTTILKIPKWSDTEKSEVLIEQTITWLRDVNFDQERATFSLGHSLHYLKPGLRLCVQDGVDTPVEEWFESLSTQLPPREKEWDNSLIPELLSRPFTPTPERHIARGATFATNRDEWGDFTLTNLDIPGELYCRVWSTSEKIFVIDYEVAPYQKTFKKGDTIRLTFSIAVTPPTLVSGGSL